MAERNRFSALAQKSDDLWSVEDFKRYVLTVPEIASDLPQGLSEFFMRLVIPEENKKCTAIVTSTMEPVVSSDGNETLPYILDIDVFKDVQIDGDSDAIWDIFEDLRKFRNEIFFHSITERAKELFR